MEILLTSLCILVAIISVECQNKFCNNPCFNTGERCAMHKEKRENCEEKNTGCIVGELTFGRYCVNPKIEVVDSSLQHAFLAAHNAKRDLIASGAVRNYGPACRMAAMQWDEGLAEVAAVLAHTCQMEHDSCRKTDKFFLPGQNLVYNYSSKSVVSHPSYVRKQIDNAVQTWYDEILNSKPSDIDSFPLAYEKIGHFTAMMTESNTHLGCAIVTYDGTTGDGRYILIICNYARSHMYGYPVYSKCNAAAEHCSTGADKQYRNLCSIHEEYNVNYYTKYDIWDWDWQKKFESQQN